MGRGEDGNRKFPEARTGVRGGATVIGVALRRAGERDATDSISGDAAEELWATSKVDEDRLMTKLIPGAKMKARNGIQQKHAKDVRRILTSFDS